VPFASVGLNVLSLVCDGAFLPGLSVNNVHCSCHVNSFLFRSYYNYESVNISSKAKKCIYGYPKFSFR
jgi:hypothetical protein